MEKEKRTMAFNVKVTPSELTTIKENAKNAGLPVSTYIRLLGMKGGKNGI